MGPFEDSPWVRFNERSCRLPHPGVTVGLVRHLVLAGLIPALAIALVVAASGVDVSKECRGAFSHGFSLFFDRYRCDLVVKVVGSDREFRVPLAR